MWFYEDTTTEHCELAGVTYAYGPKGDPCNMDHLRICLQIIVKFQLASANYKLTPSCRALSPRLELACIVLNGTQYIGKKRD